MEKKRIAVGLSGGVDSAVAALLLKEQGHDVIGIFMKNWDEQAEDGACTAAEDFDDVRAIADTIGIPYYTVNFEKEYWDKVFEIFLAEYRRGRTPNPDVLCNSEIKFDCFLNTALGTGADLMATGHYAQLSKDDEGRTLLMRAADENKDQTYFLCNLSEQQISRAAFPIGHMIKNEVRDYARAKGIPVAEKKDSTGVCFIGERRFKEFLSNYLPASPGDMKTLDGKVVGRHDGLMYYTLGQRRGLGIGGSGTGERWFVVRKDLENNVLYVSQGAESKELFSAAARTEAFNFINPPDWTEKELTARFRHRQPLRKVLAKREGDKVYIEFGERERAITPGQYAVLYDGQVCLGGGVVDEVIF